jgi:hypothetical protein
MDATPQFTRAKREHDAKPITFEVEGEQFALRPKMTTRALEAIGRAQKSDVSAMFDFLRAQLLEDGYDRVLALDLDVEDELPAFIEFVAGMYGDAGKSDGSPTSSSSDGTSSKRTGAATTA